MRAMTWASWLFLPLAIAVASGCKGSDPAADATGDVTVGDAVASDLRADAEEPDGFGSDLTGPDVHTSLALDPGEDPGASPTLLVMLWHHHSTGDAILDGGLRAALAADNVELHEMNYGDAQVDDYNIGDHTDVGDFPTNFNTPEYFDVIKGFDLAPGQVHRIIMFKSCFPNSDIDSDAMLEDYKTAYNAMLPTFEANPGILFIPMSTPPLVKAETTAANAARARAWAKWITTEYAKDTDNVQVFDVFNALAILEGHPDENTLAPQFAAGEYDSHPNAKGAQAVTRMFIPWFNRAIRAAGVVD